MANANVSLLFLMAFVGSVMFIRTSAGGGLWYGGHHHHRGRCGDGRVDAGRGEECDDGNKCNFDGCSSDCQEEGTSTVSTAPPTTEAPPPTPGNPCSLEAPDGDETGLAFSGSIDCTGTDVCTMEDGDVATFTAAGCRFQTFSIYADSLPSISAGTDPTSVGEKCTDATNEQTLSVDGGKPPPGFPAQTTLICEDGVIRTPDCSSLWAEAFGGDATVPSTVNYGLGSAANVTRVECLATADKCIPCYSCQTGDCPQCTPMI